MTTTSELPFRIPANDDGSQIAVLPRRPTNLDQCEEDCALRKSQVERKTKVASRLWKHRVLIAGLALVITRLSRILLDAEVTEPCDATDFDESFTKNDAVWLSIDHLDQDNADIKAAVCFKTLFGSIDIGLVIQWAGTS